MLRQRGQALAGSAHSSARRLRVAITTLSPVPGSVDRAHAASGLPLARLARLKPVVCPAERRGNGSPFADRPTDREGRDERSRRTPTHDSRPPGYVVVIPTLGRPCLQDCLDALAARTGRCPVRWCWPTTGRDTREPLPVRVPAVLAGPDDGRDPGGTRPGRRAQCGLAGGRNPPTGWPSSTTTCGSARAGAPSSPPTWPAQAARRGRRPGSDRGTAAAGPSAHRLGARHGRPGERPLDHRGHGLPAPRRCSPQAGSTSGSRAPSARTPTSRCGCSTRAGHCAGAPARTVHPVRPASRWASLTGTGGQRRRRPDAPAARPRLVPPGRGRARPPPRALADQRPGRGRRPCWPGRAAGSPAGRAGAACAAPARRPEPDWLLTTAEFALARMLARAADRDEIVTMAVTSALIPPLAVAALAAAGWSAPPECPALAAAARRGAVRPGRHAGPRCAIQRRPGTGGGDARGGGSHAACCAGPASGSAWSPTSPASAAA